MKRGWSNLLTLLLASLILIAGFILPSIIYPWLDPFMGNVTRLEAPAESFDDVELPPNYPWDIYDASEKRPLTSAEQALLLDKNVPDFLIKAMGDRGMPTEDYYFEYYERILVSFLLMSSESEDNPSCFVLSDFDLDLDGRADFKCAASLDGDLIHFLILNNRWSELDIQLAPDDTEEDTSPNGSSEQPPDADEAKEGEADEDKSGEGVEGDGLGDEGVGGDAAGGEGGEGGADGEGGAGGEVAQGPTAPGAVTPGADLVTDGDPDDDDDPSGTAIGEGPLGTPSNLRPLLPEDRQIWYFAFAISQEASMGRQTALINSFRQIDMSFRYVYQQSFENYLREANGLQSIPDETVYTGERLNPVEWKWVDYTLKIFDLPQGSRIIFYIDPRSGACMGFSIW